MTTPRSGFRSLFLPGLLLLLSTTPASASVIYTFYESTGPAATLEVASPPASGTTGWSTSDPLDLLSFSILGSPNLVPLASSILFSAVSLTGDGIDFGGLALNFDTIPGDPAVDHGITFWFSDAPGEDGGAEGFTLTYADGSVVFVDTFLSGDWAAEPIPEPATLTLLGLGLAGSLGRRARRRRLSRHAAGSAAQNPAH